MTMEQILENDEKNLENTAFKEYRATKKNTCRKKIIMEFKILQEYRKKRVEDVNEEIKNHTKKRDFFRKSIIDLENEIKVWKDSHDKFNYQGKTLEKLNNEQLILQKQQEILSLDTQKKNISKIIKERQHIAVVLGDVTNNPCDQPYKTLEIKIDSLRKDIEIKQKRIKECDSFLEECVKDYENKKLQEKLVSTKLELKEEDERHSKVKDEEVKLYEKLRITKYRFEMIKKMIDCEIWKKRYLIYAKKHSIEFDDSNQDDLFEKCNLHHQQELVFNTSFTDPNIHSGCIIKIHRDSDFKHKKLSATFCCKTNSDKNHSLCQKVKYTCEYPPYDLQVYNIESKQIYTNLFKLAN